MPARARHSVATLESGAASSAHLRNEALPPRPAACSAAPRRYQALALPGCCEVSCWARVTALPALPCSSALEIRTVSGALSSSGVEGGVGGLGGGVGPGSVTGLAVGFAVASVETGVAVATAVAVGAALAVAD